MFGLHIADLSVVLVYFAAILFIGVFLGKKQTNTLGDFFIAGGKWGPYVAFIFVFASSIAGSEATVVGREAYNGGLSGVWMWWNVLFATPLYFLFATYYKRARVYNLAEFLEMRYGKPLATFYAVIAGISCLFQVGMIILAIGKILSGFMGLPEQYCVWAIAIIVSSYVFSGGMMSALLTDLLQGMMCFFILGFVMLPFVWNEAGGMASLQALPKETWDFIGQDMSLSYVFALNFSGVVGGIAAPWIFNWIAIARDEKAGTQCAWAHLWKRVITLLFAFYGIFFAIIAPNLADPEMAWGIVMKQVLPVGVGIVGLMIATFFAAAMSSIDTFAAVSSAMSIDYIYRKTLRPGKSMSHYLTAARLWSVAAVVIAAIATSYIGSVLDFLKLYLKLLAVLGIPIYFAVVWRRANRLGMWMCVLTGMSAFLVIELLLSGEGRMFPRENNASFIAGAIIPSVLGFIMMWLGSIFGAREDECRLDRFYAIMKTPIGQEQRLVDAGVRLPLMIDDGLVENEPESLDAGKLRELRQQDGETKLFGPESDLELYRLSWSHWYVRGFLLISAGCVGLVVVTWLVLRMVFVW